MLNIEIAYATPSVQTLLGLSLPSPCTAEHAVHTSGILLMHPDIPADALLLGIFSKRIQKTTLLRDGDRIELYRPLIDDPKRIRRRRAEAAKAAQKAQGKPHAS